MKSKAKTTAAARLCRGPCVALSAGTDSAEGESSAPKPRWLEAAYTGHFKGHWMGEFEFTRKTFEQIVSNLQKHPAFVAGTEKLTPDEIQTRKLGVVQFDFHHASEMHPTDGDIAVNGAPAQGWVLDAKIQDGEDGKSHLWVYAYFMEPAATYIAQNQYKWVSVSVDFNGPDPETGEPIGAVLTSVALTNHPFLRELPPIAASRIAAEAFDAIRLGGYYYGDAAMTPEEAFEAVRRCLGLPETIDAPGVAAEIAKLKQWSAPGATPPAGVDVGEHIAKFRAILS
ncbi:MAG TPA: phage protease, partial [Vicinamibacterales bacterium]|nr:phage protease [Vicinamibacterales bacterium]